MNSLEKRMVEALKDLKENHHVEAVKAEFEAEGTRLEEALRLKEVVTKAGLDLTIKIGGCEAIKDMYDARTIGVNCIVAPMIETAYAMSKYVKATKFVFPEEERNDVKFLLNVETITGYNNLQSMIEHETFKDISGVVLGRVDMTGSMGLTREDVNSEEIFEIAHTVSAEMQKAKKDMVVGGGVSAHSLGFFKRLPYISRFETRKIIFNAEDALKDANADKGVLKAVGFELLWLQNKREFYKMIYEEDAQRLAMLTYRYKALIEEAGGTYV
ncbi:citrate lyase beta subunit [bacterium]|nr:citrate lyase beta subunit [bacterium]